MFVHIFARKVLLLFCNVFIWIDIVYIEGFTFEIGCSPISKSAKSEEIEIWNRNWKDADISGKYFLNDFRSFPKNSNREKCFS